MTEQDVRTEALRIVVDRVAAWQESATEGTIRDELDTALDEVGIDLTGYQRAFVTQQISGGHEVDVQAVASDAE